MTTFQLDDGQAVALIKPRVHRHTYSVGRASKAVEAVVSEYRLKNALVLTVLKPHMEMASLGTELMLSIAAHFEAQGWTVSTATTTAATLTRTPRQTATGRPNPFFARLSEAFPNYDQATLPLIPTGFLDQSWGADACPFFFHPRLRLALSIDVEDRTARVVDGDRFVVFATDAAGAALGKGALLQTEDWGQVQRLVLAHLFAEKLALDPWHILPWLTQLRVKRLIIENVWEFLKWGPVDEITGKPIKEREGEYFNLWRETIERLGFDLEVRRLNAANYGGRTTRSRMIMMGRSDGRRIIWPAHTHARNPDPITEPHLKRWRPAREIIDPTLRGKSIFNRKKPLAEKTITRIYAGAVRHGWEEPFLVLLREHMTARGIEIPATTVPANDVNDAATEAVLLNMKRGAAARTLDDCVPTLTAEASHVALAEPMILSQHSTGAARPTSQPLPTITTGSAGAEKRRGCARPAVVEGFVLPQESGGVTRSQGDPLPTIATKGAHALIAPYYGDGSGLSCTSSAEPLPTATTKARFGLVLPVTQKSGGARARSLDEPVPTMTTSKRGEFAMVMPLTHHDVSMRSRDTAVDPIPTVTGANRGELALLRGVDCEIGSEGFEPNGDAGDGRTYDIHLRMLDVPELAAAMGLVGENGPYRFTGTKTDQIKQIGNAVSVEKMEACVLALAGDAAPALKAKPVDRLAA